jgi:phosphatidylserine/phosphatidylglycerophosphate/cardiolipin synthase-like enzyme
LCVPLIRKRHRRNHRNHGPEQQECRGLRSFCGITTSRSRILPKGISTSLSAEDNGAVGVVVGGVEFYVGPPVLGAPDDLDAVIRDFLGAAKHSLAIAVQEVDSRSIADAILAAMQRGVRVQLILEGDYLVEAHPSADPWALAGEFEEDRIIHSAFLRAGVDVITDLNPAIFHQKFVVRDVGESTAAVLTGSTNFTLTDTGQNRRAVRWWATTSTIVVILDGQTAANEYAAEFLRLRSGTFGDQHERHEPKPTEFRLGGMRSNRGSPHSTARRWRS